MQLEENHEDHTNSGLTDAREAARQYRLLGLDPIPLPARKKAPTVKGWQNLEFDDEDFSPTGNIGVRFGENSDGVVDIDLDWPESRRIASIVLPNSPSFGRATASGGHRLVRCRGVRKVRQYKLTEAEVLSLSACECAGTCILEIRAGGQTMVPPSVHPNGEPVQWEGSGFPKTLSQLPKYDFETLKLLCDLLAFLSVVLRAYPRQSGMRNEVCLAIVGALFSSGIEPGMADEYTRAVAQLAGDEEWEERANAVPPKPS